jgi:hypothetical protein
MSTTVWSCENWNLVLCRMTNPSGHVPVRVWELQFDIPFYICEGWHIFEVVLQTVYHVSIINHAVKQFYNRHHELVDRYEISISQIVMDIVPFT